MTSLHDVLPDHKPARSALGANGLAPCRARGVPRDDEMKWRSRMADNSAGGFLLAGASRASHSTQYQTIT